MHYYQYGYQAVMFGICLMFLYIQLRVFIYKSHPEIVKIIIDSVHLFTCCYNHCSGNKHNTFELVKIILKNHSCILKTILVPKENPEEHRMGITINEYVPYRNKLRANFYCGSLVQNKTLKNTVKEYLKVSTSTFVGRTE